MHQVDHYDRVRGISTGEQAVWPPFEDCADGTYEDYPVHTLPEEGRAWQGEVAGSSRFS